MKDTMDRKLSATLQAVLLFFILSHPLTYKLTTSLVGGLASYSGCPTPLGLVVHAVVFGVIVRLLMN
jgi:hypothetical protein